MAGRPGRRRSFVTSRPSSASSAIRSSTPVGQFDACLRAAVRLSLRHRCLLHRGGTARTWRACAWCGSRPPTGPPRRRDDLEQVPRSIGPQVEHLAIVLLADGEGVMDDMHDLLVGDTVSTAERSISTCPISYRETQPGGVRLRLALRRSVDMPRVDTGAAEPGACICERG